ncbi:MAG: tryptophan synthase subunit alpha [Candidatus Atribacteria bacterium]|nr:tryptophan synthase subunit alpha [Candidatus Atribacteria bacterium]
MRIEKNLRRSRERGRKSLIIYITAGDPDLKVTEELVYSIAQAGADVVELGIPFSDPLADGPTVQQASQRALNGKVTIPKILNTIEKIRKKSSIPIALMTYYNPIFYYGLDRFVSNSKAVGADGLIVPDLPLEESKELRDITERFGIELIPFITPTTTSERIEAITKVAQGFIYCVSVTGVTGIRENLSLDVAEMIRKIRPYTDVPLAIGFGISNTKQAKEMIKYSDAIIVGSAVIKIIENYQNDLATMLSQVKDFVRSLKKAITTEERRKNRIKT